MAIPPAPVTPKSSIARSSRKPDGVAPGAGKTRRSSTAVRERRRLPDQDSGWTTLQRVLALFAIVLLASRVSLAAGINLTMGTAFGLALLPFWLPVVRSFRGARPVIAGGLLCVAAGALLTSAHSIDHQTSIKLMAAHSVLAVTLVIGVGVILWARTLMHHGTIAIAFGAGLLLAISSSTEQFATNPWKFGFSLPAAVIVLGIGARINSRATELIGITIILLVSVLNDSRSFAAMLLLAALFVGWQLTPQPASRKGSTAVLLLSTGALAVLVYFVGQSLILNGALGEETQERSQAQLDASGSLILGGRPEIGATLALFEANPSGFGSGTKPSHADLNTAKAGMASLNYDPNNGYVERYMFGSGYEVHSVIGDMWASFGWAGLAFLILLIALTVGSLAPGIRSRSASGLALLLSTELLWNAAFSPLYSSLPLIILTLGIMLPRRAEPPRPDQMTVTQHAAAVGAVRPARLTATGRTTSKNRGTTLRAAEPGLPANRHGRSRPARTFGDDADGDRAPTSADRDPDTRTAYLAVGQGRRHVQRPGWSRKLSG